MVISGHNKKKTSNMKKIYQNPELKVVKIKTAQLLAGSPLQLGIGEGVGNAKDAESRRFGSFLDDEEDY